MDYCVNCLFIAFYSHIIYVCELLSGLFLHIGMDSCVDFFFYTYLCGTLCV